ncbi:MAG: hypothetical protein HY646_02380, partial [Acidobacteria bacterium]|nr:hypothetical protein [Acidobacteriota bacterium]
MQRFVILLFIGLIPSSLFANTIYFPQVVQGGGYSTSFYFVNEGAAAISVRVNFYDQSGARVAHDDAINLPSQGSTRFILPNSGPVRVLWGEVVADGSTVKGIATVDFGSENSLLIASAAISGVEGATKFQLPVDITSTESTGIAIANVGTSPVSLTVRLFAEDGSQVAIASDTRLTSLGSRRQVADFVSGIFPQLQGATFKGTVVVESAPGAPSNSLAVTALAVRQGNTLSPLPVVATAANSTATGNTLYFPHLVFGGGYSAGFVVMNSGSTSVSSRVDFYDQSGVRQLQYSVPINLPAGGSTRFTLPNTGPLTVLWGELVAVPGSVGALATLDYRDANSSLIMTDGVLGIAAGNPFLFPVESTGGASTGIALANVSTSPLRVGISLLADTGPVIGSPVFVNLGPREQVARFLTGLFPQLGSLTLRASLLVSALGASLPSLAATALPLKVRGAANVQSAPAFAISALPRD